VDRAERELYLRRYAEGPALLREALARVPGEAMQWRPEPGRWSVHEIIVHCADSETNAAMRIRYLAAEPNPVIQGYDQDRWARYFDYHAYPPEVALAQVEQVRRYTVELIRRLPEEAWGKVGTHTEAGRYGAEDWLRTYAEHLEVHARQIARNLEAWHSRGP
jgi:hypothetical protein